MENYEIMVNPRDMHTSMNLFFFWPFKAAPGAYGDSQAKGQIRAAAANLRRIPAVSVTCTTAHGNAGSITC